MKYIGIDPGKKGSVSIIDDVENLIVWATPVVGKDYDIGKMFDILNQHKENSIVVVERAQAMPKQGVVSMFEFGRGYGIWLGILTAAKIPYQIIHSRVWTKLMLHGAPGEGKARAFHVASRLFPSWNPKYKYEYEYADSILLAEYCKRIGFQD